VATSLDPLLSEAERQAVAGDVEAAEQSCARALQRTPDSLPALRLRAVLAARSGDASRAIAACEAVLRYHPDDVVALGNLGPLRFVQGDTAAAIVLLERAVRAQPQVPQLHANLAGALALLGRLPEALASYDAAVRLGPLPALTHLHRGVVLERLGDLLGAVAAYRTAHRLDPALDDARNRLAQGLLRCGLGRIRDGDFGAAVAALAEAVSVAPGSADARGELARALMKGGQFPLAVAEFGRALSLAPDRDTLWYNLGVTWLDMGDPGKALEAFSQARRRKPRELEYLRAMATAALLDRRPVEAVSHAREAHALDPEHPGVIAVLAWAQQSACDWRDWPTLIEAVRRIAATHPESLSPIALLPLLDDPQAQHSCARGHAATLRGAPAGSQRLDVPRQPGPLRIAYVSSDFGEHPVGLSIVEVIERHDRSRVRPIGVSLRMQRDSPLHGRLRRSFAEVHDVAGLPDRDVAALLRSLDVDIAVDLNGYSERGRPLLFAAGAARVQVGYLGYPGTLGAPWLDYLIADPVVVPDDALGHYSERVVRLPVCFFPSDTTQRIAAPPTREQAGLPADAVVLACMTQLQRLLPETFAVWLRILRAEPATVLWLSAGPEVATTLREQARAAGVAPERLCFAQRLESRADYLGRLSLADLFLDVFPYGGHSTVRDAIYSGVPVLVRAGRSFPSRVAASLLQAAGMADWIVDDWEGYEARARECIADPGVLLRARAQLSARDALPLFNMRRLTAELEAAYDWMLEDRATAAAPRAR
jgi:protein O-GlcNAc transferase